MKASPCLWGCLLRFHRTKAHLQLKHRRRAKGGSPLSQLALHLPRREPPFVQRFQSGNQKERGFCLSQSSKIPSKRRSCCCENEIGKKTRVATGWKGLLRVRSEGGREDGVPYLISLRRHSALRGFKMSAADALLNLEMSPGVWARGGMQKRRQKGVYDLAEMPLPVGGSGLQVSGDTTHVLPVLTWSFPRMPKKLAVEV